MDGSGIQHRQGIDLVRFVAAFGVAAAHVFAYENDWIGHLALAAFLMLSAFLAAQSMQRDGGVYNARRRMPRLLVPWLFWCVVYKIVLVQVTDGPEKFVLLTDPYSLLMGPFVHLWYLPFVALASLAVAPAGRVLQSARAVRVAAGVLVGVGVLAFWLNAQGWLPMPLAQWVSAVPSFAYGLIAAAAVVQGAGRVGLLAFGVMCAISYAVTGEVWTLQPFIAAVLFGAAWHLPLRARILPHLGQVAFGIYLVHPFFLLVCFKIFGAQMNGWLALGLTFVMAWVATIGLRAVPFLRRMV